MNVSWWLLVLHVCILYVEMWVKIHRYAMNTYYVQSTVLGANPCKFYSKLCQWLTV